MAQPQDNARTLLEPHELAELGPSITRDLPLDLVDPNPQNPRKDMAEIEALAENIRTFGLLQPVTVRRAGDRYELLGGHRRRAAFQMLRDVKDPLNVVWRTIPAVVRTMDDDQSYLALLSGQMHTRGWKPREEAAALERLAITGLTLKQIGERLSRNEAWASKRLRIYADSVLSGFVQTGKIPPSVAEELLRVQDLDTKRALAERAAAEHWTQDRVKGEVRALQLDAQLRAVARQARDLLTLLSAIDAGRLPKDAKDDLMTLQRRIVALARGAPILPTIEAAQQRARVKTQDKPSRTRRAGYKPRR